MGGGRFKRTGFRIGKGALKLRVYDKTEELKQDTTRAPNETRSMRGGETRDGTATSRETQ
jgi:hypothetical protein